MKYIAGFVVLVMLAAATLTLVPGSVPIGDTTLALWSPFSLLYAMRGVLVVILAVVTVIILIIAIIRGLLMRKGIFVGVVGACLLIITAAHTVTLAERGLSSTDLPPDHGVTHVSQGNGEITVMSFNTLGGETSMSSLAPLVAEYGVDVIVLVETGDASAHELAGILAAAGTPFTVHSPGIDQYQPEIKSTVILTSTALGEYVQVPALDTTWSSVKIVPASGNGPQFLGVHPIAPSVGEELWRSELETVYAQCETMSNTVMAGDFNSTVDHMHAAGYACPSALDGFVGAVGTWPTSTPAFLGAPIDNIFSDLPSTGAMVVQAGDSDHRGVIARLQPAG